MPVLGETGPLFPKLKLANDRGEIAFNALDTDPRWRDAPEPGTYTCTAWIPPNLLNEGVISVDATVASFEADAGAPQPHQHAVDASSSTSSTPGSETRRRGS